jgi:hypothetical protein
VTGAVGGIVGGAVAVAGVGGVAEVVAGEAVGDWSPGVERVNIMFLLDVVFWVPCCEGNPEPSNP